MVRVVHPWLLRWVTPIGLVLFSLLFMGATQVYPGGSQADPLAPGFSWQHNYWCNLTNLQALNGESNPARWIAIPGLWILSVSLLFFLFLCINKLVPNQRQVSIMYILSCCTMACLSGVYSRWHDGLSLLASIFGLLLIVQLLKFLRRSGLRKEFQAGALILVLLALNALIYYSKVGLTGLPILQKITFLLILIWVFVVHRKMIRMPIRSNISRGNTVEYQKK